MLYNIVYVDSGAYAEIPPIIHTIELNDEEYKIIKDLVKGFEKERKPYFYPQMYIFKVDNDTFNDGAGFISCKKQEIIEWKRKQEEREERMAKIREGNEND